MVVAFRFRRGQPSLLRTLNTAVEIARRESEDQEVDGLKLEKYLDQKRKLARLADDTWSDLMLGSLSQAPEAFRRDRANLGRCRRRSGPGARHRLDKGHWPEDLKELVPAYLPAVPHDPDDGQPICAIASWPIE